MKNQRIYVSGGTGFLGSETVRLLVERGYEVSFAGRNEAASQELCAMGAKFIRGDLRELDKRDLRKQLHDIDAVVHCAALSSPWGKFEDFFEINVKGTEKLSEAALDSGVKRFIFISSPSIYFDFKDRLNIKESDAIPSRQACHYARSKVLAEQAVAAFGQRGLPGLIIRPRGIFGKADRSILSRLLRANKTTGIPFIDGGKFLVDITHVRNVAEAIYLALALGAESMEKHENKHPKLNLPVFNISNDEPLSFDQLLQELSQALQMKLKLRPISYPLAELMARSMELSAVFSGREPVLTRYTLGLLAFSQTLNIEAAKSTLNYRPQVSLKQGFAELREGSEYGIS